MFPFGDPEASVMTVTGSLGMAIIASAVGFNSWRGAQNTNSSNYHLPLSNIILILGRRCCLISNLYIGT